MRSKTATVNGLKTSVTSKKKYIDAIGKKQRNITRAPASGILTHLDFPSINERVRAFADHIESHFDELADILLEYESFEVVQDETERTLDHLRHLKENEEYFVLRIGEVTSFLPRNQPLYALTCFVIIPSLMASEVHFRIPHSMRHFFPRLIRALKVNEFFPNVIVSSKERLKFLKERSALRIDPKTEESLPVTDAVIFTGTPQHADRLRLVFDQRTLFIANGSGHNPVVVAEDADLSKAVDAVIKLQLYNQGQDCANPNAILVHKHIFKPFMRVLREELGKVRVGHYRDRSCRVGPISEPDDLQRIQTLLVENREWLDARTPGVIRTSEALVEPTIICKPLKEGANFSEVFAPIIFIQQYDHDIELAEYFEHPRYAQNAMYVSVYGTSFYVEGLVGRRINGKVLHDRPSVLHDTHLHAPGMERGTQPYGGNGYGASSLSINGKIVCKATLPQRDIYEHVAKPFLLPGERQKRQEALRNMKKILTKDVQKLMGLKVPGEKEAKRKILSGKSYVDALDIIASDNQRYIEFEPERIFTLLDHPNVEHIATMQPKHVHQVRVLRKYLREHKKSQYTKFTTFLYAIPKKTTLSEKQNRKEQLEFFQHLYQLLLGRKEGPRLAHFLLDANRQDVLTLLNV